MNDFVYYGDSANLSTFRYYSYTTSDLLNNCPDELSLKFIFLQGFGFTLSSSSLVRHIFPLFDVKTRENIITIFAGRSHEIWRKTIVKYNYKGLKKINSSVFFSPNSSIYMHFGVLNSKSSKNRTSICKCLGNQFYSNLWLFF